MLARQFLPLHWILMAAAVLGPCRAATTKTMEELVRIAELDIDPARLDAYTIALKEEISTSIAVEPGVLTLYAVAVKDHPNQIKIFERYADQGAYERHIQSPHFKKYKSETQTMVRSLKLIETSPIVLGAKAGQR
jgi:quinol monooxygenase YgiN